jgi:hypothetical protein
LGWTQGVSCCCGGVLICFCCDATLMDIACWIGMVCCGLVWRYGCFELLFFVVLLCFLTMFDFVTFDIEG